MASLQWAEGNAVRLEAPKTEAILFSRRRRHCRYERGIRVGDQTVHFSPEATRWLGVWLGSTLTLAQNRRRRISKTRQAEARLRRIVNRYGVPPAAARNLQIAVAQAPCCTPPNSPGVVVEGSRGVLEGSKPHGQGNPGGLPLDPPGGRRR